MPQISIEHSANAAERVDLNKLMHSVHETVRSTGFFRHGNGIRSRLIRHEAALFANGDPENAFIEIRIRLAHGRSADQRAQVGRAVFETAKIIAQTALETSPFCVSVDVEEINPVGAHTDNNLHVRLAPPEN